MFLSGDTQAQSHYARVPTISHPRNGFSIAKRHLTTIQFDKLFPMYVKFIYPGDTHAIQHHMMARLQTQISDLFDDLYFDVVELDQNFKNSSDTVIIDQTIHGF